MLCAQRRLSQREVDDIALREAAPAILREMADVSKTLDAAGEILLAKSDQAFAQRLCQSLVG